MNWFYVSYDMLAQHKVHAVPVLADRFTLQCNVLQCITLQCITRQNFPPKYRRLMLKLASE